MTIICYLSILSGKKHNQTGEYFLYCYWLGTGRGIGPGGRDINGVLRKVLLQVTRGFIVMVVIHD